MATRGRGSLWTRVAGLERSRGRGPCALCGGDGYPATFVRAGAGAEPQQVGSWSCRGCGRVGIDAVVVLDVPGAREWGGSGTEERSP